MGLDPEIDVNYTAIIIPLNASIQRNRIRIRKTETEMAQEHSKSKVGKSYVSSLSPMFHVSKQ